jgi:hypothetical protein
MEFVLGAVFGSVLMASYLLFRLNLIAKLNNKKDNQ